MLPNSLDIQEREGALVVTPVGDIDLTNAEDLRAAILASLSNESSGVIIDLTRTRYLDSAGIRVLFSVAQRLHERRRRLAVVTPSEAPVRRLLAVVDMENHADLHETLASANAGLRYAPRR